MKDIKHLIRGCGLAVMVIIAFTITRNIVVPDSFGKYGWWRAEAVTDEMSREPLYQGAEACKKCHEPRHQEWSSGKHGVINCEDCHGPAKEHVAKAVGVYVPATATAGISASIGTKTMTINRSNDLCLRCHLELPARPGKDSPFPQRQINLEQHMKGKAGMSCFKCHNPHHPDMKPPEPVETTATGEAAGTATKPSEDKKAVSTKGRSIYNDKCIICHGARGDGKTEAAANLDPKPPNFARLKAGIGQMIGFITNGKGDLMPAYKDELSGEDIKEVAGYVDGFKGR